MAYCVNCGTELVGNAKFCQKCGTPTQKKSDVERKQEFAGKLYKCPSCGEVLKSFEITCPSCGHELRGAKASSAVKEFALKLEAIESKREYEKPKGIFAASEAMVRVTKTDEQKISLIKSFAVPNSKEDMLEFMILATSSMNLRAYDSTNTNTSKGEKELNEAWYSKVEQVYEKAKRTYSSDDTFAEIDALYQKCNKNIEDAKKKGIKKWILLYVGPWVLLFVVVLPLIISAPKKEAQEIERLENIVIEVQEALDAGEYRHALRIADSIDYQRYEVESERKWDIEREYWVEKVIDEAAENGITLEYTYTEDVDNANDDVSNDAESGGFVEGFNEGFNDALDSSDEKFQDSLEEFKENLNGTETSDNQE